MPVKSTAAKKAAPRKIAKKAPAKKAPAKRAPRVPKDALPTPPWRSWNLPPESERDQWTWYGPAPDSTEYREFQEYIAKYKDHPDFKAAFDELRVPGPTGITITESLAGPREAKRAAEEQQRREIVYMQPDRDSLVSLISDAQRRYQSEPPRLYVIIREVGKDRVVLATDLFDRGNPARWTTELEEVKLFGAKQAAEQLRKLDKTATEVELLGGLVKYAMEPADLMLYMVQMNTSRTQLQGAFLDGVEGEPGSFEKVPPGELRRMHEEMTKTKLIISQADGVTRAQ